MKQPRLRQSPCGQSVVAIARLARNNCPNDRFNFVIEPYDVQPIAFKPSEDGRAWIVRLLGSSGESRKARLHWMKRRTATEPRVWLSDLTEQPLSPITSEVEVAGQGIVTIRIERD